METISRDILLAKGYKEWKNDNYQKLVSDEEGKKYFINIECFDFSERVFWGPYIQLETDKGSVKYSLIQWFNNSSGRTIEEMEEYFEALFVFHNKPYYERI